jgi:hypothetical protein
MAGTGGEARRELERGLLIESASSKTSDTVHAYQSHVCPPAQERLLEQKILKNVGGCFVVKGSAYSRLLLVGNGGFELDSAQFRGPRTGASPHQTVCNFVLHSHAHIHVFRTAAVPLSLLVNTAPKNNPLADMMKLGHL